MASVDSLSDSELRHKLIEYGFPVGPVTETSRKVLVKKLKHLMSQAGRSSDAASTDKWRRSLLHFSSGEEESENEDSKILNSSMPPPSSDFRSIRRKSSSKQMSPSKSSKSGRRNEINLRSDLFESSKTSTPESEQYKPRRSRYSAPPVSQVSSGARRSSTRSSLSVFKDGFDTGSDSDIDSHKFESNTSRPLNSNSSERLPHSPSFVSRLSSLRSKQKSDDSGGDSVNTLLGFRKQQQYISNTANTSDDWYSSKTSSTPFQSNFVKRLSGSAKITSSACNK
ncbi:hypothetical protein L9F63_019283, partial [Diploptera punctata]